MKNIFISSLFFAAVLSLSTGCSMQKMDVKAEAGRPEGSQIDIISLPYDASRPKYVLIVEPFESNQDVITYTHGEAGSVPINDKMAAQLTTALTKVGNFVLYDKKSARKISLRKGEKGPYILRATLTEFNEMAEGSSEESGVSLGGVGAVMGIAGAIADKPGLMWTGAGLAAANPGYESGSAERKGMVAFDLQIIEKNSGRIIDSFEAAGTFKAQSAINGISLFGISNAKTQFASSAIGQALRAAMNDAVQKTSDSLR